jgi:Acetyl co-enzyme A carboxylase carboxyltransferase alpha subunit
MGSAVVGVIGTLLGVVIGAAAQQVQASRNRTWQRADLLRTAKRAVYAGYLRSISASYAQALSGQRSRSDDASLLAATAEIEVLSGVEVSVPARDLATVVIDVHSKIAAGAGVAEAVVAGVDRRRYRVIDLFKADLGLTAHKAAEAGREAPDEM